VSQFDPFARQRQGRSKEPRSKEPRSESRRDGTPPMLLDWLQNRWPGTTVCARDLYCYAPRPIRDDRKIALELAETLVAQGWLAPIKPHRHDRKVWQIVGKSSENTKLPRL